MFAFVDTSIFSKESMVDGQIRGSELLTIDYWLIQYIVRFMILGFYNCECLLFVKLSVMAGYFKLLLLLLFYLLNLQFIVHSWPRWYVFIFRCIDSDSLTTHGWMKFLYEMNSDFVFLLVTCSTWCDWFDHYSITPQLSINPTNVNQVCG